MARRTLVWAVLVTVLATPVHAQFVVIDVANLAQAVLIVQRAQRQYEELQAQYRTIVRMSQQLGGWTVTGLRQSR
jgi:uncharacterized membrane protein